MSRVSADLKITWGGEEDRKEAMTAVKLGQNPATVLSDKWPSSDRQFRLLQALRYGVELEEAFFAYWPQAHPNMPPV